MRRMVNAAAASVRHHEGVEITAAFVAFLVLVAAWLACPATTGLVTEPSEDGSTP
jgi:hypothetical protein